MKHILFVILAIVSLLLAACSGAGSAAARGGRLRVVATFSVIGDFAQNIGGDKIALTTLVGPGRDTHTFEPTPADSAALAEANLIFENGLGFEPWLNDLYEASGSRAKRIAASNGIEPLTAGGTASAGSPGIPDPHIWHSAANAVRMVINVGEALAAADPANAAVYQSNAESYVAQLQALDSWIFEQVKALPPDRRKLVTNHDTLSYFAARYGFEILGAVLPASTEGASPSAQQIAQLAESVQAAGVPAVFAENIASNNLLKQVADEAGVRLIGSLYTDALGQPGSAGDTYLKMMRANVQTLVKELGG